MAQRKPGDSAVDKILSGETKKWTVPPFCDSVVGAPPPGSDTPVDRTNADQSFVLTQSVVYFIDNKAKSILQNVSLNEGDYVEWSKHGDPCGVWMRLDVSNMLELAPNSGIYLYNRTHKRNCTISVSVEQ